MSTLASMDPNLKDKDIVFALATAMVRDPDEEVRRAAEDALKLIRRP